MNIAQLLDRISGNNGTGSPARREVRLIISLKVSAGRAKREAPAGPSSPLATGCQRPMSALSMRLRGLQGHHNIAQRRT